MRLLVWFPLLLALAAPAAAWPAEVDLAPSQRSSQAPRQALARPPASPREPVRLDKAWTAKADPATLCETTAATAEYVNRLPPRLLHAISLTENGRVDPISGRIRPWPWTINAEGVGRFFATGVQAVAAVKVLQARCVRSIDVGCLQVNLMYHPDAFASLEDAFDPRLNATYAAGFLNVLYAEGGQWAHAIAAYHSQTRRLGAAYRVLVMARWENGGSRTAAPARAAYRDVGGGPSAYGAFAPRSRVYGAFAAFNGDR